jgi:hypothetical protein
MPVVCALTARPRTLPCPYPPQVAAGPAGPWRAAARRRRGRPRGPRPGAAGRAGGQPPRRLAAAQGGGAGDGARGGGRGGPHQARVQARRAFGGGGLARRQAASRPVGKGVAAWWGWTHCVPPPCLGRASAACAAVGALARPVAAGAGALTVTTARIPWHAARRNPCNAPGVPGIHSPHCDPFIPSPTHTASSVPVREVPCVRERDACVDCYARHKQARQGGGGPSGPGDAAVEACAARLGRDGAKARWQNARRGARGPTPRRRRRLRPVAPWRARLASQDAWECAGLVDAYFSCAAAAYDDVTSP